MEKWRTERPLLALNALVSAGLWFLFLQSYQSIVYVGMILALIALVNVASIAYVRGSAVRLGPNQFPDLYAAIEQLSQRIELRRTPDVYLMQKDGALNAFAMRFLRSHMVVLLSDLLEACGDNRGARDMIIGHELGHIRSGHLYGRWLLMPASFVPFLGAALSRAREYTCDRYGAAAAGYRDGALLGLSILAAGGNYGRQVNREALVNQRHELQGVWMLVGEWLGSHPPLSRRLLALAPELELPGTTPARHGLSWVRPAFAAGVVVLVGMMAVYAYLPRLGVIAMGGQTRPERPVGAAATAQVSHDLARLTTLVETDLNKGRPLPWDVWDLYARWQEAYPSQTAPVDPFSGYWYDYDWRGNAFRVWSAGPDGRNRTPDDIVFDSRTAPSN